MGQTNDIHVALETKIASDLVATVLKAWPDYDRTAITFPSAAIMWVADEVTEDRRRVSGGKRWETTFEISLYCANELSLMTYVDNARAMFDGWPLATISTYNTDITVGRIERIPQDADTPAALRYAATFTAVFGYTR